MRSHDFGIIENISRTFSSEISRELFRKICVARNFETKVKEAFDKGFIKMPIYLSFGQEAVSAALSLSFPRVSLFAQHRCHDLYLSYGGERKALVDELLHRETGCARGMGGSASIHSPPVGMFGHDGLMGTQIPIAVGYAISSKKHTLAIMGDASAEEDYVMGAIGYAAHKKAPVLFVCYDNGLSILTKVAVRRNWKLTDIASAFGIPAVEITDDPWLLMHYVGTLKKNLPAFINVHVVRHLWHAGTGKDSEPEWDRYAMIKHELNNLGLGHEIRDIELRVAQEIDTLWNPELSLQTI